MSDKLSRPLAQRVARLHDAPPPAQQRNIPAGAIEGAVQALADGKTHYTTRPGIVPLREWVSGHIEDSYGMSVAADAITITCGLQEALFVCFKKLAADAKQVLYSANNAHTVERLAALLDLSIICTPDDPQSISMLYVEADTQHLADWLALAQEYKWWIVWNTDAVDSLPSLVGNAEIISQTVLLGSLEAQLPGWAVGWMAGSDMAAQLRAYKQSMTICSPSISQWAAYGMVSDHAE